MEELSCVVQQYAWGKLGAESEVARFKQGDPTFEVRPSEPYAELWMGTHVSGPSKLKSSSESLAEYLLRNPSLVGHNPKDYPTNDLAFLFKVLSIRTALSIQAHPDRSLARELHAKFPNIYKDPNHKPEMAIALSPFEAMCGFRPVSEIQSSLKEYPEFASMIGEDEKLRFQQVRDEEDMSRKQLALKELFFSFMRCEESKASANIQALIARLRSLGIKTAIDELILRLHDDYPGDRGVLCPLLLNYITLNPGESFFMGANEPHAYISGDCIECMAISDNVVRAGLTPKFKDVETLMHMLHFRCGKMSSYVVPLTVDERTVLYRPPHDVCAEFEVERTVLPKGEGNYHLTGHRSASLILVTHGSGKISPLPNESGDDMSQTVEPLTRLKPGTVLFQPANQDALVSAEDAEDLVIFRAHVNLGDA